MRVPLNVPHGLQPRPAPVAPHLAGLVSAIDAVLAAPSTTFGAASKTQDGALIGDEIMVLQRQINRLTCALFDRVARFDAIDGAHELAGATTASWLRHRTGLAPGQSSDLVRTSRALREELPHTRDALEKGDVTGLHASTVARTVRRVTDAVSVEHVAAVGAEVEQAMVAVSRSVDVSSLSGFAHRVRQMVDPDGVLADANRAHDRRWLIAARTVDGMVNLEGLLDPESGATVMSALATGSVPTGPSDLRNSGQRRADALVELCRQAMNRGEVSSTGGVEPHLLVTASWEALRRGLTNDCGEGDGRTVDDGASADSSADSAAGLSGNLRPSQLEWAGPVPDETARRFACDATLTRVLINPQGMPLDIGRSTRVIPPAIRTALVVRDGGCVADCCDRPPSWTEAHHVQHWIDGGKTSLDNLVLLCRSHHRKVHEEHWSLEPHNGTWVLLPP